MVTTWTLKSGAAHRRVGDGWERVTLAAADVGGAVLVVAPVAIDGVAFALFQGRDGERYAQPLTVAVDPETVGDATEPQPEPTRHG